MHTCRLCLSKDAKHNIFKEGPDVSEKIMLHCKLLVYKDDGLPHYVCKKCYKKLRGIVQFVQKCEETDKILRKQLNLPEDVKNDHKDFKCEPKLERDDDKFSDIDRLSYEDYGEDDDDRPIKEYLEESAMVQDNGYKTTLQTDNEVVIKHPGNNHQIKNKKIKNSIKHSKKDYIKYARVKIYINKPDRPETTKAIDENRKNSADTSQLCPVCGKYFPKANSFRSHMKIHDGESFKCEQCSKCFSTKVLLRNHEKRHLNVRGFLCKICGKTFTTNTSSKRHMEVVHQKLKLVPCELCNKTLSTPRALREHIKIHTGVKNYECDICNKRFTYKISLTFHTRVHTGEKPFPCRFCESKFAVQKTLKDHERLHTGEKPYVCPVCNKGFMQGSNMKSHFRNNHKGMELPKKRVNRSD